MFAKTIAHPFFKKLERGLFSYSGSMDVGRYRDVAVSIKGRSQRNLDYTVAELDYITRSLDHFLSQATEAYFEAYEAIKDAVQSGDFASFEEEGGHLPELASPVDIWNHVTLERIVVEPSNLLPIRLGFRSPWDIEHDFGLYVKDRVFQYCGVSV